MGTGLPHLRMKHYFIENNSWSKLHEGYCEDRLKLDEERLKKVQKMEYSTFTQYVHEKEPGLRLARTKQDVCDSCIRLDFIIANPASSEEDKEKARAEK